MSMIVENSVCVDCNWKNSCQKVSKLREMCNTKVNDTGRPTDTFNVVVTRCSLKNLDRSIDNGKNRGGKNKNRGGDDRNMGGEEDNDSNDKYYSGGMYYCLECQAMHHENSRIGKLHKKEEQMSGS